MNVIWKLVRCLSPDAFPTNHHQPPPCPQGEAKGRFLIATYQLGGPEGLELTTDTQKEITRLIKIYQTWKHQIADDPLGQGKAAKMVLEKVINDLKGLRCWQP